MFQNSKQDLIVCLSCDRPKSLTKRILISTDRKYLKYIHLF